MGILYLGQLVAFLLIVLTIHRTSIYSTIWQLHQAGDTAWSNQKDWVLLSTNREFGAEARNQDSRKMLEEQWKKLHRNWHSEWRNACSASTCIIRSKRSVFTSLNGKNVDK